MKATKFKTLDIVESIHTGEVHLVTDTLGNIIQIDGVTWFPTYSPLTGKMNFKKLSYKDVKINLNTKNN